MNEKGIIEHLHSFLYQPIVGRALFFHSLFIMVVKGVGEKAG